MKNENTKKFLDLVSKKDSGWLEKAKWREENEDWLDISFSIAVKMLSALSANKKAAVFPSNQKELAVAMKCSAQYVNKLLKGQENLQIETICKIQRILNIKLLEVPKAEVRKPVVYENQKVTTNQFDMGQWFAHKSLIYQNTDFENTNYYQEEPQLKVA